MTQKTLAIIKPDGVSRGLIGEVIKRYEKAEFRIVAMKLIYMTKEQVAGFYREHEGRPYFEGLIDFMASGPSVVMVLGGDDIIDRNRELIGPTDHRKAPEGTIRRDLATDIRHNVVHGSDSPESAASEIAYFFNALELGFAQE